MIKHFVTFGEDHKDKDDNSLLKHYLVIEGNTPDEIREKIFAIRGKEFCTDRHWSKIAEFRQKYDLTEVSLVDCIITDITLEELEELFAPPEETVTAEGLFNDENVQVRDGKRKEDDAPTAEQDSGTSIIATSQATDEEESSIQDSADTSGKGGIQI